MPAWNNQKIFVVIYIKVKFSLTNNLQKTPLTNHGKYDILKKYSISIWQPDNLNTTISIKTSGKGFRKNG